MFNKESASNKINLFIIFVQQNQKNVPHVRREGLQIMRLIEKREEYASLDYDDLTVQV